MIDTVPAAAADDHRRPGRAGAVRRGDRGVLRVAASAAFSSCRV